MARMTSSASFAIRISSPGTKKRSSPDQASVMIAAPQAAASNSRPDGKYPMVRMDLRVTLSVSGDDAKKAEWSTGGRCLTKYRLGSHGKSSARVARALPECRDRVSALSERAAESPPQGGVTVSPRRTDCQAEDQDAHASHFERAGTGRDSSSTPTPFHSAVERASKERTALTDKARVLAMEDSSLRHRFFMCPPHHVYLPDAS